MPTATPKTTGSPGARSRRFGRLRGLPWRRILPVTALIIVVIGVVPPLRRAAALGVSKVILFVASPLAPDVGNLDDLSASTKVLATDGSVLAQLDGSQRREPVRLDALPDHVPKAVLAAEDANFYQHSGIDPSAVFRALLRNVQGKTQGGSTITQQLAKLNYTSSEKTILRKLKEVLYASKLEKRYSKDELLERYLNQVYFGDNAYGIAAASKSYFGIEPEQLSVDQAAMLAGKIRSPSGLDPRKVPDKVKTRRNQVLNSMVQRGFVPKGEVEALKAKPIEIVPPQPTTHRAPHFIEFVKREAATLDALGGSPETRAKQLFTGGYTVSTTLDPKVFDAATLAVQATLAQPNDPTTAVATVQPGDGAIRSLFGGLDFATTQYDVASRGTRQPGSSFKPFVYMTMLREKISPKSTFDGTSPRLIKCFGKEVRNYNGEDAGGAIDVDQALVNSVNTVFAELGCQLGSRDVEKTAMEAGVPEDATEAQPALFLGGLDKGVTALTMASAFATFAAKGIYARPYGITKITDRDGKVVYEHKVETRQVFDPKEAGVLNATLMRVVREGTGKGAAIGRPVAGKTGTTTDNLDAWFTGFVPQLATSVWVGYPEPKPMQNVHGRSVTGGSFPASIFAATMKKALQGVKVEQIFTAKPEDLDLEILTASTTTSSTSSTSSTSTSTSTTIPTTVPTTPPTKPGGGPVTTLATSTTSTTKRDRSTTTSSTTTTAVP
ncbi:MAG TPA: transglycosylase domain-containing protein [Acidimicrobiales bacterium]|nr:transglycosylase domain-containing protein [Acidimicrobiales bacterium]